MLDLKEKGYHEVSSLIIAGLLSMMCSQSHSFSFLIWLRPGPPTLFLQLRLSRSLLAGAEVVLYWDLSFLSFLPLLP
ncbi:hypothetical protein K7I13_07620 [Brucepastera parasyntrophica]|uniref:hypothetical protein n=1 Tax=Brucepastera parasyntrophica TaxID=2880008 RepID=UPI00210A3029|nr:hypothetical protein [Brucepastera parasyntrophica]ULQ58451.1 hypothetical protein K7I13_07620 [Brucepastera parasyntrophica]